VYRVSPEFFSRQWPFHLRAGADGTGISCVVIENN
jgi:hypothetical protein